MNEGDKGVDRSFHVTVSRGGIDSGNLTEIWYKYEAVLSVLKLKSNKCNKTKSTNPLLASFLLVITSFLCCPNCKTS